MGPEPGVVQLLDRVFHVIVAHVLNDSGAVLEHVREADVSGLSHVVLQVLPAARRREAGHHAPVLGPPCRRASAAAAPAAAAEPAAHAAAAAPSAPGELYAQLVAVVVVSVPGVDGVLRVSGRSGKYKK